MSQIPVGQVTVRNGQYLLYKGLGGYVEYGVQNEFDIARHLLTFLKSDPDVRAMMSNGWTLIEFKWNGTDYAIINDPGTGISVIPRS